MPDGSGRARSARKGARKRPGGEEVSLEGVFSPTEPRERPERYSLGSPAGSGRGATDVVTREQVGALQSQLSQLTELVASMQAGGGSARTGEHSGGSGASGGGSGASGGAGAGDSGGRYELGGKDERIARGAGAAGAGDGGGRNELSGKDEMQAVQAIKRRLQASKARTGDLFDEALDDFKHDELWPWNGTARSTRAAPAYLASVYKDGKRARDHVRAFLSARGLEDTSEGDGMYLCASVIDMLLIQDHVSILNSAGVEILARRMLGLERSLTKVSQRSQLSRRGEDLKWLDLVYYEGAGLGAVDEQMKQEMKHEAELSKWLTQAKSSAD